jgi:hypothetical protein
MLSPLLKSFVERGGNTDIYAHILSFCSLPSLLFSLFCVGILLGLDSIS